MRSIASAHVREHGPGASGRQQRHAVVFKTLVARHDRQPFGKCLGYQHAVERVLMVADALPRRDGSQTRAITLPRTGVLDSRTGLCAAGRPCGQKPLRRPPRCACVHALCMDVAPIRSGFVSMLCRAAAGTDDGDVADNGMPDRRGGGRSRGRWSHRPAAVFPLEPGVAAVFRLAVVVAALWALLFVLR